ncbi:MAG: VOC family protein [Spirochaetaceae bacterium]|nr:MAG: VOC family protein [Spirochaetaceae bacterium]
MKFCWVTLHVKDIDSSLRFYQELLGLQLVRRVKPIPTRELAFLAGEDSETQVELVQNSEPHETADMSFGKDISLGFEVPSLEGFGEVLSKHNIPIHAGPIQPNPSIRFMYILDPDGLLIQLVERRSS